MGGVGEDARKASSDEGGGEGPGATNAAARGCDDDGDGDGDDDDADAARAGTDANLVPELHGIDLEGLLSGIDY